MSVIIDIADAVAALLNLPGAPKFGTPPAPLNAARTYRPTYELGDAGLRVAVVPKGVEVAIASRSAVQADVRIDVGVQKKLLGTQPAELDELMALVEAIADFLRLAGQAADAVWVGLENAPIWSQEHLKDFGLFTSVLTLTYRLLK